MRILLVVLFAAYCAAAAAQLRTIPDEAKRGVMSHIEVMTVNLNGQAVELSAGVLIRDAENRIIVPVSLPPDSVVKYQLDAESRIRRVWILTPDEAAQTDTPPAPTPPAATTPAATPPTNAPFENPPASTQ
jgi:hypothetical protein